MRGPGDDGGDERCVEDRDRDDVGGELGGTGILVNAACPGFVATDLNGFRGVRTPAQGAATAIPLATLPDDGPTGGFFEDDGVVPW